MVLENYKIGYVLLAIVSGLITYLNIKQMKINKSLYELVRKLKNTDYDDKTLSNDDIDNSETKK